LKVALANATFGEWQV
jgi:hypothetical protein